MDFNKELKTDETDPKQKDFAVITLTLKGITTRLRWDKQMPLLDAILNAGIAAPHSCCRGNCGTCVCKLEEGEVRLKRNFVLSEAHLQQGLILTCVAVPISDFVKITYDEF